MKDIIKEQIIGLNGTKEVGNGRMENNGYGGKTTTPKVAPCNAV